jgi:hypothetical protein
MTQDIAWVHRPDVGLTSVADPFSRIGLHFPYVSTDQTHRSFTMPVGRSSFFDPDRNRRRRPRLITRAARRQGMTNEPRDGIRPSFTIS